MCLSAKAAKDSEITYHFIRLQSKLQFLLSFIYDKHH